MLPQIHDSFRARRLALGLSQSEVARRAGIQQRQVSVFERGADVTLSTLQKLGLALDLNLVPVPRETSARVSALLNIERAPEAPRQPSPASRTAPPSTSPLPSLLERYQMKDAAADDTEPSID